MADGTADVIIEPEGEHVTLVVVGGEGDREDEGRERGRGGEGGEETTPSKVPRINLRDVHCYKPGEKVYYFLPQVPVMATVTSNTGGSSTRRRVPRLHVVVEHGPFKWSVDKFYREFLALRRDLVPLRSRIRRHRRDTLPPLLKLEDMNVRQGARLRKQVPKVQTFLNAVLSQRSFRAHPATAKFLEISRISFVQDTGEKMKEGLMTKRSGGHRRVTNCLGCTACCVCRCSVWRERWFVLKDSYLVYVRAHHTKEARRTIAGVVLFDSNMTINHGLTHTGVQHGLKLTTQSRELLMRAHSHRSMLEWVSAITDVAESSAKEWVQPKPHFSFAPERSGSCGKWFVDGEFYMAAVADAIVAAKDEIYITDWMLSPHVFLKREGSYSARLEWRLDHLLLRKAREGVRVFIQLYKEIQLAIDLGSEFAMNVIQHPNVVVFRHPEHIQTGVYLWAHHEKIIIIDQTLAFVGGIDLAFGRWDNACHRIHDSAPPPPAQHVSHLASAAVAGIVGGTPIVEETDHGEMVFQKWVGKDYYNPFIKDYTELHEPLSDQEGMDRGKHPRMPWHDVSSCVYGAAARDVARHFIQRYNFTKHEQEQGDDAPYLLPRKIFSEEELEDTQYLRDLLENPHTTNASVQVLRSVGMWSAGIPMEHSVMTAWISAIDKAEHFIYIEQQFFISSLLEDEVLNGVAEALRLRIARAHREGKTFRVIVVMPLLPSFEGEFGESSGTILEAVIHWNYRSIARGEDSLYGKLHHQDGIPEEDIHKYISVFGLRTHGEVGGNPTSEIVYVHSKCMIVDDRITIIGSANINDRSMLGERDSEVALRFEDKEMVDGTMNGEPYKVGKFSHSLRCHLFKEHLGLLESQQREGVEPSSISVEDPASDEFYINTWIKAAHNNTELYEEVFGGKMLPSDKTINYGQLWEFRENCGLIGANVDKAREALLKVQGSVVEMPLHFLERENLLPDFGTKESFAPDILVT